MSIESVLDAVGFLPEQIQAADVVLLHFGTHAYILKNRFGSFATETDPSTAKALMSMAGERGLSIIVGEVEDGLGS